MSRVSNKYQVVLDREVRRCLGIRPGWIAIQTLAGDHLEIRFLPPEHDRSVAGRLRRYARPASSGLSEESEASWTAETRARWDRP